MWVSFKMPGKWLCWPHPHSEILFWELLTKLQPKEQELTHLYSTHPLHTHSSVCLRCTWAEIKPSRSTLYLRDYSQRFCTETPALSLKVVKTPIFITTDCCLLSVSALLLLNTSLGAGLENMSVILLFATQTGHEQRGKDKWASISITTYA